MAGWIKLDRAIQNHWLWEHEPFSKAQAWIDMLMSTNFKPSKFRIKNGAYIELARGECGVSKEKFAKKWQWSKGKVTRFFSQLSNEGMIEIRVDKNLTIITINNYSFYQNEIEGDTTNGTTNSTTNSTTNGTTLKKEKKEKNKSMPKQVSLLPTSSDSQEKKIEAIPYKKIVSLYHEKLPNLPMVKKLTDKRKRQIKARWNESKDAGSNTLSYWSDYFEHVSASGFLSDGRSKWCNLEWLTNESNFVKVIEGNYHNGEDDE